MLEMLISWRDLFSTVTASLSFSTFVMIRDSRSDCWDEWGDSMSIFEGEKVSE